MATSVLIYARGKFEVQAPFALVADVSYTATAIRSFREVQAAGIDIFANYYAPMGLDQATYDSDRVNATSLVTLQADEHPTVIIPTTYILSAPTTVGEGFSRMVIGVDIGILPDGLDLTYVTAEIVALVSDLTGLQSDVQQFTAPITGLLTPEQAESFEQNRIAAIRGRTTHYAQNQTLQDQLNKATALAARYEQIILQSGIVKPATT
jgi:hypothetical protein